MKTPPKRKPKRPASNDHPKSMTKGQARQGRGRPVRTLSSRNGGK